MPVEIFIAVAVLSIQYGCLFLTGGNEENIAREMVRATAWLDGQIYRAAITGKSLERLASPSGPPSAVRRMAGWLQVSCVFFKQKDLHPTATQWFIIISACGLTRMSEFSGDKSDFT